MKVTRTEDQEARKKEGKQQAVRHTCGGDSEDDGEDGQLVAEVNDMIGNREELLIVSGRKCRCGSTQHQRTSHKDCPN